MKLDFYCSLKRLATVSYEGIKLVSLLAADSGYLKFGPMLRYFTHSRMIFRGNKSDHPGIPRWNGYKQNARQTRYKLPETMIHSNCYVQVSLLCTTLCVFID